MKRVFLLIVIPALLVALGFAQASPPVCSPTSGVAPLTVTCTTSNQGGTLIPMMCYNFTGSPKPNNTKNGCTTGTLYYTGPISVTTGETLYIVAGALVFDSVLKQDIHRLVQGVDLMSSDYTLRAVRGAIITGDRSAITSMLATYGKRLDASLMMIVSLVDRLAVEQSSSRQYGFGLPQASPG